MSKLLSTYDRSRIPLYVQVASVLRQRIESGHWQPGDKLSTLEQLEKEFEVARVTVRQAVKILREEGRLYCRQGRGTFVADQKSDRHWFELASNWEGLLNLIKDNVPKRITLIDPTDPPQLQANDGALAQDYVMLKSVQYKGRDPYSIVNLHLAKDVFLRDRDAFLNSAALVVIAKMKSLEIGKAHQSIVIGSADPEVADLLKVGLGTPTAECRCVVVDKSGTAVYVANVIYRGDCIKLHMDLLAGHPAEAQRTRLKSA